VSHHPPISAFHSYNTKTKITFEGWCEPKTSISINSASSFPNGNFRIRLNESGQVYNITKFPNLTVYNIFFGQIELDVSGEFEMECLKTKTKSNIQISKGGKYEGEIKVESKNAIKVKGTFENGTMYKHKNDEFKKIDEIKRQKILVKDISDQENNESRKVWHSVTMEILKGDFDAADLKKKIIEEGQRKLRIEKTDDFVPKYFEFDKSDFGWKLKDE
jgi:oxysterol-binding protein-related protein 9/10/11